MSGEGGRVRCGVQQIMLGTRCRSEAESLATLRAVKAAGYDGLELNRFMIRKTSWLVRLLTRAAGMPTGNGGNYDWPKLLQESGLQALSLHTDLGSLEKEPEAVYEDAAALGTDTLVITGMYRFDYGSEAAVKELAQRLSAAGSAAAGRGLSLLYHNHNCELQRTESGTRAYELLLSQTDPETVGFEFDSYWMTDAGADAAAVMASLGRRLKLWHINDRGCRKTGPYLTPILKEDSMELGYGNMDLDTMMEIALRGGVRGIILESHKNWAEGDPVKSLTLSAAYLKERLGGRDADA